jgi:hypothetical protein
LQKIVLSPPCFTTRCSPLLLLDHLKRPKSRPSYQPPVWIRYLPL